MDEADAFKAAHANVKVYKQVTDFTNYTKALALNLGDLLGGGAFDVASVLAELNTVELGLNFDIRTTLDDVINWTYQFTKFIDDKTICEYLYFIATSLKNNAEFQSLIGLNLDLKAYLQTANLVKMISGDTSVGILQVLEGAKIYLELTYETNFHGEQKPKALLWVEIKDGKLTGKVFSPIVLTGYVPDLLKSVSMMSSSLVTCGSGFCGKGYKEWVKVSDGGPYMKARIRLG